MLLCSFFVRASLAQLYAGILQAACRSRPHTFLHPYICNRANLSPSSLKGARLERLIIRRGQGLGDGYSIPPIYYINLPPTPPLHTSVETYKTRNHHPLTNLSFSFFFFFFFFFFSLFVGGGGGKGPHVIANARSQKCIVITTMCLVTILTTM